jgi:heterodisulfide reductase subunit A-like polyferredoxin
VYNLNSAIDVSSQINKIWLQIIAGGGLSGLVVGNKLSEKGYNVLVVEFVWFAIFGDERILNIEQGWT